MEILIYVVILATFFLTARVSYSSFITRKQVESVVLKVESFFTKARSLAYAPHSQTQCVAGSLKEYRVTLDVNAVSLLVICGSNQVVLDSYTYENNVSAVNSISVGYKLLGHGLNVTPDFFGDINNYQTVFSKPGGSQGVTLTLLASGEVQIASN